MHLYVRRLCGAALALLLSVAGLSASARDLPLIAAIKALDAESVQTLLREPAFGSKMSIRCGTNQMSHFL